MDQLIRSEDDVYSWKLSLRTIIPELVAVIEIDHAIKSINPDDFRLRQTSRCNKTLSLNGLKAQQ